MNIYIYIYIKCDKFVFNDRITTLTASTTHLVQWTIDSQASPILIALASEANNRGVARPPQRLLDELDHASEFVGMYHLVI